MRSIQLLTLLAATAATLPAQWALQSPTTSPSPRRAGAACFDPASNRMIIYGGLITSPAQSISEMWSYDGQWTQIASNANARWGHQMVADTANNRLVTFGGRSPTISSLASDTRVFDGMAMWQQIQTTNAPSARFLYGMAYDSNRDRVILFGGRDGFAPNNETWEFDGTDWLQIQTSNAPAPREEMGMVYDASLNRVVLFGGCDESTQSVYGDTWWFDGVDWANVTPSNSPSPRFRGSMVYDSDRSRSVYFGGFDGTAALTDVLEYSGGEWSVVASAGATPSNTTEAYAAYDSARQVVTQFGGFGPTFSNATWEFTGNTDGVFSLYGQACDLVSGTPNLSGTTPNIGSDLILTVDNLTGASDAVWLLGFNDQAYSGVPLPLDLGFIGLSGCNLLTSADVIDFSAIVGDTTSYTVPLPSQATLVGQSLFVQMLPIQLPLLTFLGSTRGGRALIGQ